MKKWTLKLSSCYEMTGGNSARRPRIGDIIAENIEKEDAINLTKRCLEYYEVNGKKKERTARFIERIGIEEFKK